MGKGNKKKGFTLAEEVVSMVLVVILILSASGILLSTLRIMTEHLCSTSAQVRGIAVMDQLTENLEYATVISNTEADVNSSSTYAQLYIGSTGSKKYLFKKSAMNTGKATLKDESPIKAAVLKSYDVTFTISPYSSDTGVAEITVKVGKNGKVYYSEKKELELKNDVTWYNNGTIIETGGSVTYKQENNGVYLGFIE